MRNRQIYKDIRQIVIDGNYTIEQVENTTRRQIVIDGNYTLKQVENTTRQQMETVAGRSVGGLFEGIKENLIRELTERDDRVRLDRIRTGIINIFPDVEFGREIVDGKRCYHVWPDGKPEARE